MWAGAFDSPLRRDRTHRIAEREKMTVWNCFHQDDPDQRFGRITRRLTFENVYTCKEDVLKNENAVGDGKTVTYGHGRHFNWRFMTS